MNEAQKLNGAKCDAPLSQPYIREMATVFGFHSQYKGTFHLTPSYCHPVSSPTDSRLE